MSVWFVYDTVLIDNIIVDRSSISSIDTTISHNGIVDISNRPIIDTVLTIIMVL
jgi:hypothetical protein